MDRLHCMQVFVRVVEECAFGRAADDLGLSRASVTAAVAQLERRLGVRLLNRTTRRLNMTDEGRAYYQSCVRILGDIAEVEDGLSQTRNAPTGRLRVSMPQSFVNDIFFPALTHFVQKNPQLVVDVVLTDRAVNLVEEGIDCALRAVEIPPDADLVARTLSATHWVTCASPAYLDAHGRPDAIADLADHDCIRFVSRSTGRARVWDFFADGKPIHFTPRGNVSLSSFDAVREMAIAGVGIAQVPDALVFCAIGDNRLEAILTDFLAPAPPISLVYPGNRYLTAKVRAFADFVADVFPPDGWWPVIARSIADARAAQAADGRGSSASDTVRRDAQHAANFVGL